MEIRFKRLEQDAQAPRYATDGSCGLDLYSTEEVYIAAGERACIPTGVAVEIPDGYYGQVSGRSGHFVKQGIMVALGLIDSDYRGGIGVMVINTSDSPVRIAKGERCGQLVILPYPKVTFVEVEDLSEGGHGTGFGHTGKY